MKYNIILITIIQCILLTSSFAGESKVLQWDTESITNEFIEGSSMSSNILSRYTPQVRIYPHMYKSITNALCSTPEELLVSNESVVNQEWQNHNYLYPSEAPVLSDKALEYRKNINIPSNGIELVGKLNVEFLNEEYCIVKFWLVDDGERSLMVARSMKKSNERWYFYDDVPNELVEVMRRVRIDVLMDLVSNSKPNNFYDPQLYDRTRGKDNLLDINKLYREMMLLREKKDWNGFFKLCDKNNVK